MVAAYRRRLQALLARRRSGAEAAAPGIAAPAKGSVCGECTRDFLRATAGAQIRWH